MKTFDNKFNNKLSYIYWREEAEVHILKNESLKKLYNDLLCTRKKIKYSTIRSLYTDEVFSLKKNGDYYVINYWDPTYGYQTYVSDGYDDNKNSEDDCQYKGPKAISLVVDKFRELNNTTFKTAFDTVDAIFKKCVPKPLEYYDKDFLDDEVLASSIDVSSQYPAMIRGKLPDAHNYLQLKGTVEPNEEYPFAFYLNSGHCAEYNRFDTHNWMYSKYNTYLFRIDKAKYKGKEAYMFTPVNPEDDITVLMKASEYELTDTFEYFFNIKNGYEHDTKEYSDAKLVMNASIGMLHTAKYVRYKYAHIAAICKARANQMMLDKIENDLKYASIIQICVDGIIYVGDKAGIDQTILGTFNQEFLDANFKLSNWNCYVAMKDNKVIKYKHGGFNYNKDGTKITDETVIDLDSQYNWIKINPLENINEEEKDI